MSIGFWKNIGRGIKERKSLPFQGAFCRACQKIYNFKKQRDNVLFLLTKKSTKRRWLRGTLRKCMSPLEPPPPHRQPVAKNVPIFDHLPLKNLQLFTQQSPENRNIFGGRRWKRRERYIGEGALIRSASPMPLSLVPFLAETRKEHVLHRFLENLYFFDSLKREIP